MAKEIDLTKPLSEFDLRYLVDRNRWDDIRKNAEHLDKDVPNLPSARGLRRQVPRKQLTDTDAFDKIAEQLGVKVTGEHDVRPQEVTAPPPVVPTQQAQAPAGPVDKSALPPPKEEVDYEKLTVPQLKEEMDGRRQKYQTEDDEEGVQLMTYAGDARKSDLVAALKLDDEQSEDSDADAS
jgi:hypothetical protein